MAIWSSLNGLNCQKCNKQIQEIRGCEKDIPTKEIEGVAITRCPVKLITIESKLYLQVYSYYKDGFLPNAGGSLDQSIKVMDVLQFIDNEKARMEKINE